MTRAEVRFVMRVVAAAMTAAAGVVVVSAAVQIRREKRNRLPVHFDGDGCEDAAAARMRIGRRRCGGCGYTDVDGVGPAGESRFWSHPSLCVPCTHDMAAGRVPGDRGPAAPAAACCESHLPGQVDPDAWATDCRVEECPGCQCQAVAPPCGHCESGHGYAEDGEPLARCCDANDCGPCCPDCPTCPTLVAARVGGQG